MDFYVPPDSYNRIYLCVPRLFNKKHQYVCYHKKYIKVNEIQNPDVEWTKISIWFPSFMDTFLLKKRLGSEILIVPMKQGKRWQGCYPDYKPPTVVLAGRSGLI
jgi:hypothetical protein